MRSRAVIDRLGLRGSRAGISRTLVYCGILKEEGIMIFASPDSLYSFVVGVIASLAAAVVFWGVQQLIGLLLSHRSGFGGLWLAEVLDDQGNPVLKDVYWMRYDRRRGTIRGRYKRFWSQYGEDRTEGRVFSVLHGECIMSVYWTPDRKIDNRGCSIVWKDDSREISKMANSYYTGFYWHRRRGKVARATVRLSHLLAANPYRTWDTWKSYSYSVKPANPDAVLVNGQG